jgi:hypothetical protein
MHWDKNGDDGCGGDDYCDAIEHEPDCVEGLEHKWTRQGEGGCDQNPGVWSLGGTSYQYSAHCRWCGARRVELRHGSQRNPYECDSVSYEEGDRDEDAITAEMRRLDRNRKATRRRHAIAVAHYGSIEAWRGALRLHRASILVRNAANAVK